MENTKPDQFHEAFLALVTLTLTILQSFDLDGGCEKQSSGSERLWTEITSLRSLTEQAVRHNISPRDFGPHHASNVQARLHTVTAIARELNDAVCNLRDSSVRPIPGTSIKPDLCRHYCESLQTHRSVLTEYISQWQILPPYHWPEDSPQSNDERTPVRVSLGGSRNENIASESASLARPGTESATRSSQRGLHGAQKAFWDYILPVAVLGSLRGKETCLALTGAQSRSWKRFRYRTSRGKSGHFIIVYAVALRRVFELTAIWSAFRSRIRLRNYPLVPESSDSMRFAQEGDFEALRVLVRRKPITVFDTSPDGWTLLHNAAWLGHLEIVRFLLRQGADTEVAEIKLRKASHLAKFRSLMSCATDEEKQLPKLFPDGEDFIDDFGLSPIHCAVLHEYDEDDSEKPGLRSLLDLAHQLTGAMSEDEWRLLKWAQRRRSPLRREIISYFERNASDKFGRGDPFHQLLEQPDALQMWTPLQWAAFVDRQEEFALLLASGADPFILTPSRRNLVHQATESGTSDVLTIILSKKLHLQGIDINLPDIWGETPLHIAAVKSLSSAQLLLAHGASPTASQVEGQTPLHFASRSPDLSQRLKVIDLLTSGSIPADINIQDLVGLTPAMHMLDSIPCLEILLNRGADFISLRDVHGRNTMHLACAHDRPAVIHLLSRKFPNTVFDELASQLDNAGDTPLLICFHNTDNGGSPSTDCARVILAHTAQTVPSSTQWSLPIMQRDRNGWSVLHHAVRLGDLSLVRQVLSCQGGAAGVFVRAKGPGYEKESVFEILKKFGHMEDEIGQAVREAARRIVVKGGKEGEMVKNMVEISMAGWPKVEKKGNCEKHGGAFNGCDGRRRQS